MNRLVLDSGGVTRLARRSQDAAALITVLVCQGTWPPVVPAVVLVECYAFAEPSGAVLTGDVAALRALAAHAANVTVIRS